MGKARQTEKLNRGLIAVKVNKGVYLGWRLFGDEEEDTSFSLYRDGRRIAANILTSTNYLDSEGTQDSQYEIRAVRKGIEEPGETASVWNDPYLSIPLQKPAGGITPDQVTYEYCANDASVGDVDGDGEFEIILKWDPTNSKDNAHEGFTGNTLLDAYKLDGTHLWRIDLGRNIRAGAHYTQFLVYDFDGDGKAEIVCKTADGTVDGDGTVIGRAEADYRNETGFILEGPEFLTVFEGATGRALKTVEYEPPRGNGLDWGDDEGNRVDRFLACVAYVNGQTPSIVMCRGYYTRAVLAAYDWNGKELVKKWVFDSLTPGNEGYSGQGNHSVSVADVDGDGCDEIIYGSCVIDHDGTGLYTTGLGHGDAMHVSSLIPSREGLEVFQVHETPSEHGTEIHDAKTGELLWSIPSFEDVGRGMAADIDPRYEGAELWSSTHWRDGDGGLYSSTGEKISEQSPASFNFAVWWDGDLLRELLDHEYDPETGIGVGKIDKWDYEQGRLVNLLTADGTRSNNGTKGNPCLQADLLGDWREEVIWRSDDSSHLRIYTTTDVTDHRIYTLMHDPVYRLSVAWQNVAYNQPPHPGFFLGHNMEKPPVPAMYYAGKEAAKK